MLPTHLPRFKAMPSQELKCNPPCSGILCASPLTVMWITITLFLICGVLTPAQATCSPPTANSYCVSIPANSHPFMTVNHFSAMRLSTLMSSAQDGHCVYMWDGSFVPNCFYGDGVWDDDPLIGQGQGFIVWNGSAVNLDLSVSVSGTPPPPVLPLTLTLGFHLLGRQTPDLGSFENITGHSPDSYSTADVYKISSVGGNINLGFRYAFNAGVWHPRAPLLQVGESAFFKVGTFVGDTSTFAVNGISPQVGRDCLSVDVTLTGHGFDGTETVFLQNGSGSVQSGPVTADADGFLLHTTFNLASAGFTGITGLHDLVVNQGGIGITIQNAFKRKACSADIDVDLVGSQVLGVGRSSQYQVIVKNDGTTPAGPVVVQLTGIPSGVSFSYSNPQNGHAITPLSDGYQVTIPTLADGASEVFTVLLSPSFSALGQTFSLQVQSSPSPYLDDELLAVSVVGSADPNEKVGPAGVGSGHFLEGRDPLTYQISFENKPEATAPAQEVIITDQLDASKVDVQSLSLGAMTFGSRVVIPPAGVNTFSADVPYDVDGNPATLEDNILVRINVTFDNSDASPTFGKVAWRFQALDPGTHQPPANPLIGFLPPNVSPPQGQGSVSFTVDPHTYLATDDIIANSARIIFDFNPPIDTAIWVNTIDRSPPNSTVLPLATTQTSPTFAVNWSGTDSGVGIASYAIFVSEDNGAYVAFLAGTTATSAPFTGQAGHTYSFYSVASDRMGYIEPAPGTPDTTTLIESLTPADQISDLIRFVNGLSIDSNVKKALVKQLREALQKPGKACDELSEFIERVRKLSGKKLTVHDANVLIEDARDIQAALGCCNYDRRNGGSGHSD